MKKILSIMLTVCMLLSMLVLPVAVQAVEADPLSEETEKVNITFYQDGTWMEQKSVDKGSKVDYNSLRWLQSNYAYDYVWSLDPDKYVAPPTEPTESVTVHAVQNPVLSFENYKGLGALGTEAAGHLNVQTSKAHAKSGNTSIKFRNYNVTTHGMATAPVDWATGYANYYQYNELTDTWEKITAAAAPEFVAGKYAKATKGNVLGAGLIALGTVATGAEISYKVSFKYLATENNTTDIAVTFLGVQNDNLWSPWMVPSGGFPTDASSINNYPLASAKNYGVTIPAGSTNGEWKTAELLISGKMGGWGTGLLMLKIFSDADNTCSNEIYIDDIAITKNYVNTPSLTKHNVYNAETGEYETITDDSVTAGQVVELSAPEGIPAGMEFLGWYTEENGTEEVTSVTIPTAANSTTVLAEDVYAKYGKSQYSVTFVNGDSQSTVAYDKNAAIEYPALNPSYNKDIVWSAKSDSYEAPPATATGNITVYAFQNPVISFENYNLRKLGDPISPNTEVSDNYAYSGSKSMLYRNYNIALQATEPADWATSYTNYYQYNEAAEKWEPIPAGTEAPTFVADKFARTYPNHNNRLNLGLISIRQFTAKTTASYKVSFKYLATENNTTDVVVVPFATEANNVWTYVNATGASINFGSAPSGVTIAKVQNHGYTIPAGSTNGEWKTAEMYVNITANASFVLHLKVHCGTTTNTNEIYFDDVVIEEDYINTPKVVKHNVYNAETGEYETIEVEATAGGTVELGTPEGSPEGMKFLGWYTSEDGNESVSSVTIADSTNTTALLVENVYAKYGQAKPSVTFVNGSTESTLEYNEGDVISYPTLPANYNYDHVWSAKQDSYEAPPATVSGQMTVYAFQNPVLSFENYKSLGGSTAAYSYQNVQISTEYKASGEKSIKFKNYDYRVLKNEPANWADNFANYYQYDEESDTWGSVEEDPFFGGAPEFGMGVFSDRTYPNWFDGNVIPIGTTPSKTNVSYKVSFKYLATENNTTETVVTYIATQATELWNLWMVPTGFISNPSSMNGATLESAKPYGITIPAGSTNGEWKTAELVISGNTGGWDTVAIMLKIFSDKTKQGTNEIYFDDITIEKNFNNTPSLTKHNVYNAETGEYDDNISIAVTEGDTVELGTPDVPAGKYFMGWYTSENGTENIATVDFSASGNPTTVAAVNVYAKYGTYVDGNTYNFESAVSTNINGLNGVNIRETGNEGSGRSYTDNGLILGIASSMQYGLAANKFDPNATSFAQVTDITKEYVASDVKADLGETIKVGWDGRYDSYVIRDRSGAAAVPKANTKYAAVVTYKKIGNGNIGLSFLAGRKTATIGSAVGSASDISSSVASMDLSDIQKGEEYLTQTFELTTGDYADEIPVFSLHASFDGYLAQRVDTTDVMVVGDKTYYPYEVVDRAQILIKEITIIEVETGNSALTFNYYEDGVGYSAIIKDAEVGTAIDVSTKIVDTNWYREEYKENALIPSRITTYPADSAVLYNAAYMMANGADDYYFANKAPDSKLTAVTLTEGDEEIYALKYESDAAVTNDYNVFRLGKVKADTTYKLTYRYKTDSLSDKLDVSFLTASATNALVKANLTLVESIEEEKDGWVEVTQYFTADPIGTVVDESETGIDYTTDSFNYDELFVKFQQEEATGTNHVYFADFALEEIDDVINVIGASILEAAVEQQAGHQALRFFFDYKTTTGSDIIVDGKSFTVVERGFLYRDGRVAPGSDVAGNYFANIENSKVIKDSKTSDFDTCWAYDADTNMMTFSTYVFNFAINNDPRKTEVKAYLVIEDEDGNQYYIHSASVNRTVDAVRDGIAKKNEI